MKPLINTILLTVITYALFALTNGTWVPDSWYPDCKPGFAILVIFYWVGYVAVSSGAFKNED